MLGRNKLLQCKMALERRQRDPSWDHNPHQRIGTRSDCLSCFCCPKQTNKSKQTKIRGEKCNIQSHSCQRSNSWSGSITAALLKERTTEGQPKKGPQRDNEFADVSLLLNNLPSEGKTGTAQTGQGVCMCMCLGSWHHRWSSLSLGVSQCPG